MVSMPNAQEEDGRCTRSTVKSGAPITLVAVRVTLLGSTVKT